MASVDCMYDTQVVRSINMLLLVATRPLGHFLDVVMPALPNVRVALPQVGTGSQA